jgi:hypothetical protein
MPQVFNRAALSQLHSKIAGVFSAQVGFKSKIVLAPELTDWETSVATTRVHFEMYPSENTVVIERFRGDVGGEKTIFPFARAGASVPLWVSWSEAWVKRASDNKIYKGRPFLELIGFSLAFYAGNEWRQKTQLLRAEWDDPANRGPLSAQPHWHIDPKLLDLPSWEPIAVQFPTVGALEELPMEPLSPTQPIDPGFWSLEKLHLGMAGWVHTNSVPSCWQQKMIPPKLQDISIWLGKVMAYCAAELPKLTAVT